LNFHETDSSPVRELHNTPGQDHARPWVKIIKIIVALKGQNIIKQEEYFLCYALSWL